MTLTRVKKNHRFLLIWLLCNKRPTVTAGRGHVTRVCAALCAASGCGGLLTRSRCTWSARHVTRTCEAHVVTVKQAANNITLNQWPSSQAHAQVHSLLTSAWQATLVCANRPGQSGPPGRSTNDWRRTPWWHCLRPLLVMRATPAACAAPPCPAAAVRLLSVGIPGEQWYWGGRPTGTEKTDTGDYIGAIAYLLWEAPLSQWYCILLQIHRYLS